MFFTIPRLDFLMMETSLWNTGENQLSLTIDWYPSLQQVKLFLKMEMIESMKPNSSLCRARFTNWVRSKRKLYDSIAVECGSFHSKSVYSAEQPMNFYTIWQILLLNYGILSENSIGIQKVNPEENRIHYIGGKVNIYFIDYVIPNSQSTLWHVWVTK